MILETLIASFLFSTCAPNYSSTCLPNAQDLFPILVILALILAAAGLTRGADIFALFGVSTLLGTSGRLGGGGAGKGFGASKIRVAARGQSDKRLNKAAGRLMKGNRRDPKSKGGLVGRYKMWKQNRQANREKAVRDTLSKPGPPSSVTKAPPGATDIKKVKVFLAGSMGELGPISKFRAKRLLKRLEKAEERRERIEGNVTKYTADLHAARTSGASRRKRAWIRTKLWYANHQLNKKGGLRVRSVPLLPPLPLWKPRGAKQKADVLSAAAYNLAFGIMNKNGTLGTGPGATISAPPPPPPKMKMPTPPPPPPPPPGFRAGAGGRGTGTPGGSPSTTMPFFLGMPFRSQQGHAASGIAASQSAVGGNATFGSRIMGLVIGGGQGTYNNPYLAPAGKQNPYKPWQDQNGNNNDIFGRLDASTQKRLENSANMAEATGNASISHVSWDNVMAQQAHSLRGQAKELGDQGQKAADYKTDLEDYAKQDKALRQAESEFERQRQAQAKTGRPATADEQKSLDEAKTDVAKAQRGFDEAQSKLKVSSLAYYGTQSQQGQPQTTSRQVTSNQPSSGGSTPPPPPPPPPPPSSAPPPPPPPPHTPPPPSSSQSPPSASGQGQAQQGSQQPQSTVPPSPISGQPQEWDAESAGARSRRKTKEKEKEDKSINEAWQEREAEKKAREGEEAKAEAERARSEAAKEEVSKKKAGRKRVNAQGEEEEKEEAAE